MGETLAQKIIRDHLVEGRPVPGERIGIKVDQTLTQDATGTLVYLELEAMGLDRIRTELSVSYVDHNTLQTGYESADDHLYLMTVARKLGAFFSPPGNGICHQVHLERFAVPGKTLLGSDSHTPTAGALGMLAIGAGGMDVALAMAGEPFQLTMPRICHVELEGRLAPWVSAKDVILELLRRLTVKGGVGKIFEYGGEGIRSLTVPQRATIANMGAELGATTSIFPSDDQTLRFLCQQRREEDWRPLVADPDARYDEEISLRLDDLEPLIALPHSPDNVRPVKEVEGKRIHQVVIGSCTNSSYYDLALVAEVLRRERVHPDVSLVIVPGSRQVLGMLAQNGHLASLISAGARVLEPACGPCIGMGQAPPSGGVTLRTFNRNFRGRSGTPDAEIYLVSPETAVASALEGRICDPRRLGEEPRIEEPLLPPEAKALIHPPAPGDEALEVIRGPNIRPLPQFDPLPERIEGKVLLKLGDNVSTDEILPAGAKVLPLRSNIPAIASYTFSSIDPTFSKRAREEGGGIIVGGQNYGQGSSREHAAFAPRWLGVRAVVAKGFARIHLANLINVGILPLVFAQDEDYERIDQGDEVRIATKGLEGNLYLEDLTKGIHIPLVLPLDRREREIVKAGGVLNFLKRGRS